MKTAASPAVYHIASSFYPSIGGAQRATETLSRVLIRQGCPVEVLTRWSPGLERYEVMEGVPVRRLGWGGAGKLSSIVFGLHTLYWVLRHGRGTPTIHTQSIDTPLLIGMVLRLLAHKHKRWVMTVHGAPRIPEKRRSFRGRLRFAMAQRLVDHVIAISRAYRQTLTDIGIPPERISLIPNGLNVDFFRPPTPEERHALRARHGYQPHVVVTLFLGRLIDRKRPDLMLRACAQMEDAERVRCLVVGDGPQMETLRTLAHDLGIGPRVAFDGPVDNVRDYYWSSDVFVLPSRWEGLSIALLEAMACGLVPVVSACEGNLEVVTEGWDGLTHVTDDLADLESKLQELVEDAALRRRLAREARRTIVEGYGLGAVADAHLRVYEDLLVQEPPWLFAARGRGGARRNGAVWAGESTTHEA